MLVSGGRLVGHAVHTSLRMAVRRFPQPPSTRVGSEVGRGARGIYKGGMSDRTSGLTGG